MVDTDPWAINASGGAPEYSAVELRRLDSVLLFGGVADRLGARQGVRPGEDPVSLDGTTVTVHDCAAVVYPGETSTSGPYRVALLETEHELDPADGSNPRKDIICCQVQDDDEDSSGQRRARSVYVAGTAAADPSEPPVPDGAFRMATVDVPASGGGAATITVNAPYAVASGGVLPVPTLDDRPTEGLYVGMLVYIQDINLLMVNVDGTIAGWKTLRYAVPQVPKRAANTSTFSGLTSTSFTATSTVVGLSFVAPATGRGLLICQARLNLVSGAAADRIAFGTPWLGTGSSINAGTAVDIEGTTPPSDDLAFAEARPDNNVTSSHVAATSSATYLVDGLQQGDDFNVSLRYRVTSSTSTTYVVEDQRIRWIPLY